MQTTRRGLLTMGTLSLLGWAAQPKTALGAVAVSGHDDRHAQTDHVLVSIFLRGGADGLSLVVPHGDDDYYRNRPLLALPRPTPRTVGKRDQTVDLNGFFGLHPALAPLLPLYQAGQMAVIPACGSGDQTRSHFEAMATMERGLDHDAGPASGWLARHLDSTPWENPSPLRGVALSDMLPASLRGAVNATALTSLDQVRLQTDDHDQSALLERRLRALYAPQEQGHTALAQAGLETLSVLKALREVAPARYQAAHGAHYPTDDLGDGMRQVACLMKCGIGLEVACLDQGGYDTHVAQGTQSGFLADRLHSLSGALSAFVTDLGPSRWARTTVVVLSEFGRRVAENSGGGTDHGRGGVMFVLGGSGIVGGKVHGRWPGLSPMHLEEPGDLAVTTDYRNVLAEILSRRLHNPHLNAVFPGLRYTAPGIIYA